MDEYVINISMSVGIVNSPFAKVASLFLSQGRLWNEVQPCWCAGTPGTLDVILNPGEYSTPELVRHMLLPT